MRHFEHPLWLLLERCFKFLSLCGWNVDNLKFGIKVERPPDPSNVPQCSQRHGGILLFPTGNSKEKDGETVKVFTLPLADSFPFAFTFKGNGRLVIVSRAGKRSWMHANIHTETPETKSHAASALENCAHAAMN